MGFLTTKAKVWYPALTDKMQLHTLFSTLASSIENGIGPRLELQEKAIGLKASVGNGNWNLPATTPTTIPYTVSGINGDFNNGFTFAGGTATVQTPGMYLVTATVGTQGGVTGRGMKVQVMWKGVFIAGTETAQLDGIWGSTMTTVVLNCQAGDTISARAAVTGPGAAAMPNNGESCHMSITLVQALPV